MLLSTPSGTHFPCSTYFASSSSLLQWFIPVMTHSCRPSFSFLPPSHLHSSVMFFSYFSLFLYCSSSKLYSVYCETWIKSKLLFFCPLLTVALPFPNNIYAVYKDKGVEMLKQWVLDFRQRHTKAGFSFSAGTTDFRFEGFVFSLNNAVWNAPWLFGLAHYCRW